MNAVVRDSCPTQLNFVALNSLLVDGATRIPGRRIDFSDALRSTPSVLTADSANLSVSIIGKGVNIILPLSTLLTRTFPVIDSHIKINGTLIPQSDIKLVVGYIIEIVDLPDHTEYPCD
jgi:hypothetical protein